MLLTFVIGAGQTRFVCQDCLFRICWWEHSVQVDKNPTLKSQELHRPFELRYKRSSTCGYRIIWKCTLIYFSNTLCFFIFHRLRNQEIVCQNWMTCLFLAWFFWTISIETLASYNGIGSSSWGLKWNNRSEVSGEHAQINRYIAELLL